VTEEGKGNNASGSLPFYFFGSEEKNFLFRTILVNYECLPFSISLIKFWTLIMKTLTDFCEIWHEQHCIRGHTVMTLFDTLASIISTQLP
jgi:hypothetical protein